MDGATSGPGPDPRPAAVADPSAVARAALAVLDAHRRPGGHTVPHAGVYPHQWLWDSCFHVICWAALGRADRKIVLVPRNKDQPITLPIGGSWKRVGDLYIFEPEP